MNNASVGWTRLVTKVTRGSTTRIVGTRLQYSDAGGIKIANPCFGIKCSLFYVRLFIVENNVETCLRKECRNLSRMCPKCIIEHLRFCNCSGGVRSGSTPLTPIPKITSFKIFWFFIFDCWRLEAFKCLLLVSIE